MASPLGHALAGGALYALAAPSGSAVRNWRPWAWAAFAGTAADLDFLPGLLVHDPSRYHHEATHSLVAALVFALLAGVLASRVLGPLGWRIAFLGVAYGSHLGLDYFTLDRTPPQGIPLLWPFSGEVFMAPVPVFWDLYHGSSWVAFVNWHNVVAVLRELAILGPPAVLACAWRLGREAAPLLVEAP